MTWFKKHIDTYELTETPLSDIDPQNPFLNNLEEDEFVLVPILTNPVVPTVEGDTTHVSTDQPTNIPSGS